MREKLATLRNKVTAVTLLIVMASVAAFATATALTIVTLKSNTYAVQAGDLTVTPVACDNVNGNSFPATGREIVLVLNTDTSTHTITLTSTPDAYGRTGDITYTVPVASGGTSGVAAINMSLLQGWQQSGGSVTMTCSAATIKVSVLRY